MSISSLPSPSRTPVFDAELISRYGVNGPRYTSYPTAPQFHPHFGEAELRDFARMSNEDPIPRPLSIYVHVPFCFSPCFYCGCTRIITRDRSKADIYLAYLQREIELTAPLFDRDRQVVQLHLGGGTPNFLDTRQMTVLVESLMKGFSLAPDADREFGIEIDPRYADDKTISLLAELGFNRLSVGIQDFDPEVQIAVNRVQSFEETRRVIDAARAAGFRSVSVDLIHGLPKQTPERFAHTLEDIIALQPDRVATYSYAHLPERFRAQSQINEAELPDPATRLALIGQSVTVLSAAGYRYIGMDHFALPDDDLALAQHDGTMQRNFQGYSTHGNSDLIGLGISSIGRIGRSFHQNPRDLPTYYNAISEGRLPVQRGMLLDDDDVVRGDAIQQLMCHGVLDIADFEQRHGIHFAQSFEEEIERLRALSKDDLVSVSPQRIVVSARGRFLLRVIAMCFDAYLDRSNAVDTTRYSKAL